ncbi:hypothetical protein CBS101457_005421 [Exobasidium rhododendri]|nr:hypothetical protein CBS101457_005421 [Exobasidium rhododendri]
MSVFTSSRPAGSPMKGATSPQLTVTRSLSKSEQLAKAVAEAAHSPTPGQYRPDSLWSEGGSDVVWSGNGGMHLHQTGFVSPPLLSPAGRSVNTQFSSTTDSSFADADEGIYSEEDVSWGGNTTMTNLSTSGSGKTLDSSPIRYPQNSPVFLNAAPPARLRRKAPTQLEQVQASDDEDEGDNNKGHNRITSIGSSIWAGRGRDNREDEAPPVPSLLGAEGHLSVTSEQAYRARQSVASSIYSQGHATEYNDSPRIGVQSERFAPASASSIKGNGEFEVSTTSKVMIGGKEYDLNDGKRRLADGTVVPKMPPMPQTKEGAFTAPPLPRARSKKGRQNRSPVLSYADGAEEEERLVEEREMREHGGSQGLDATSRMGPRVKKNSPAPWETAEEDEVTTSDTGRISSEGRGMSSRPSLDILHPPNMKASSSTWARQSMESFRNRNTSGGSQSQQSQNSSLPSALSKGSLLGLSNNRDAVTSPTKSPLEGNSPLPSAPEETTSSRRSRSKSVSSSASGMLKGLGLASSPTPATKKPSKFGKAFRGRSVGIRSSSSSNGGLDGKKNQGISSEDFAHLPPSPLVSTQVLQDSFGASSHPLRSDVASPQFDRKRDLPTSSSSITQILATTPTAVLTHPTTTTTSEQLSSSNESHAETYVSGMAASSSTDGTSLGVAPSQKADLADLIVASGGKYRDQSFVPSPPKAGKYKNLMIGSNKDTGSSSPASASGVLSASSSQGYHGSEWESAGQSSPTKHRESKVTRSDSATPTAAPSEDLSPSVTERNSNQVGQVPSATSFEGVPYKLISLQAARQQQQQQQQQLQQQAQRQRKSSISSKEVARLDHSTSYKSLEQLADKREEARPAKTLKTKKSGFLRMFGKDRSEGSEGSAASIPAMPSDADLSQYAKMSSSESTGMLAPQTLNAPALSSLRPVSSMFNGFAPGLLNATMENPGEKRGQDHLATFHSAGRLAPSSPSIHVHSVDDQSSRASNHAHREDTLELPLSHSAKGSRKPAVDALGLNHMQARDAKGASPSPSSTSDSQQQRHHSLSRRSIDSTRSDASSSLGLVSSFPTMPASQQILVDSYGSTETFALASATKSKAMEIEGKISALIADLMKLRSTAAENGLVSPNPSMADSGTQADTNNHSSSSPTTWNMAQSNASNTSIPHTPTSPLMLNHPIPPCSQCGCQCAEQKRIQAFNEMGILKGISVLERGRALKPLNNNNAGKFGSYVNR